MKAVVLHEYGGPEKLKFEENVAQPQIGGGAVLIAAAAASVNPIDWKVRSGMRQKDFPLSFPAILGRDASGVVRAVGVNVNGFKVGDRVLALSNATYAELVAVDESVLTHLPDGVELADAAAIPLIAVTGDQLVRLATNVKKGQVVLITGALGSVGRAAVHTAKKIGAQVGRELAAALSTALREVLEPLLREVESLNERIREYDQRIEQIAKEVYPEVALLKQVKGVGTQIALTYLLTIEDPHRFAKSRDVGCFLGLRPGRRNSGQSEPQKNISKEGDRYLRTMLVQGAHYILGPFGEDSDLRRWGLKLAERGGKNAKKRAVVAVARKLAVLLHRLWVSGEVYEPLRNTNRAMSAAA